MEERITRANVPAVEMTIREFLIAQLMGSYLSRSDKSYDGFFVAKVTKIADDMIVEYDKVFHEQG